MRMQVKSRLTWCSSQAVRAKGELPCDSPSCSEFRCLIYQVNYPYLECDNTSTLQPAGVTTLEDYCSAKEWTSWRFVYLLNHIQLQWPTPLQLLMITENKSGIKLATCRITLPTATSSLILEILLKCTFRTGRALRELVIFAS